MFVILFLYPFCVCSAMVLISFVVSTLCPFPFLLPRIKMLFKFARKCATMVLYGSNAERSAPGALANHCLSYTGLYLIGNSLFGSNFLAPWFSYNIHIAISRKFNLELCQIFAFLNYGCSLTLQWTGYTHYCRFGY